MQSGVDSGEGIVLVFRKFDIVCLPSRPGMARAALAPEGFFIGFPSMKAEGDERCDDLVSRENPAGASSVKQIRDASQAPRAVVRLDVEENELRSLQVDDSDKVVRQNVSAGRAEYASTIVLFDA